MIEKTRIHVPLSYRIQGWTNSSLYVDTSEVSGILTIPSMLYTKAPMQPNIPGVISKSLHQFLAQQQQTQFAVIAVQTVPEKLLFSPLIQTDHFLIKINKNLTGRLLSKSGTMIMLIVKPYFTR